MMLLGIDLAWGERAWDGVCAIRVTRRRSVVTDLRLVQGDGELLDWVNAQAGNGPALTLVDAPLVCPNWTGRRPVDGLVSDAFRREHAGCHPANRTRCVRPVRIAERLIAAGFSLGWELDRRGRRIVEVYPHPALVRWFGLRRIVKYKRGPVAARRREFRRLQRLLRRLLAARFAELELDLATRRQLHSPWSKPVEDQLDALICALIGVHHVRHRGRRTQVFGDLATGFILVPAAGVPVALESSGA
jgi:predicted RNase H-like nuclease